MADPLATSQAISTAFTIASPLTASASAPFAAPSPCTAAAGTITAAKPSAPEPTAAAAELAATVAGYRPPELAVSDRQN